MFNKIAFSCLPLLPHNDWIRLQVAHVDYLPLGHNLRMWSQEYPTHMGKEETPFRVVRIGISFRILVVHSMVVSPRVGVALKQIELLKLNIIRLGNKFFTHLTTYGEQEH